MEVFTFPPNSIVNINSIAFTLLAYPVSYLEFIATLFGLLSVYLASKRNILTWPTGIINEWGFFLLFYQVQLYADMLLQVYFFAMTLYGWYYWNSTQKKREVTRLSPQQWRYLIVTLALGTMALGLFIRNLHLMLPAFFQLPAAFPFIDAFTTITSIIAMLFLAKKILDSWLLWIAVDVVSIGLYTIKDINVVAVEYAVFLLIAIYGYIHWQRMVDD